MSPSRCAVSGPGTTTYNAGSQILLQPGFTAVATPGSSTPSFIAAIVPPPFYPNSGSGVSQTFGVAASDPGGYANITNIQIIYNWQPSGVDGCLLNYDVVNDALEIGDLAESLSTFGSLSLRSPSCNLGDLVSSNCQILGAGFSLMASGNNTRISARTFRKKRFVSYRDQSSSMRAAQSGPKRYWSTCNQAARACRL